MQKILRDGTRRVMEISEVVGVDPENKMKPLINTIYKFEFDGNSEYYPNGRVKLIGGRHVRVGKLSNASIEKMMEAGVPKSSYEYLMAEPNEEAPETETYEGIV